MSQDKTNTVSKDTQEKLINEILSSVRKNRLVNGREAYAVLDVDNEEIVWSGACERNTSPLVDGKTVSVKSDNPFLSRLQAKQLLRFAQNKYDFIKFE